MPVVKILLRYNASPDITDSHGWSAIQYAERNPEIVQLCEQVLRVKRSEYTVRILESTVLILNTLFRVMMMLS